MICSETYPQAMEDIFNCCSTNFILRFESLLSLLCGSVFSLLIVAVIERLPTFRKGKNNFYCTESSCSHCGNSWLEIPRRKYEQTKALKTVTERISNAFNSCSNNKFSIEFNGDHHVWTKDNINGPYLDDILLLEDNYSEVLKEYHALDGNDSSWQDVCVPSGKWSTFHLINQGIVIQDNVRMCPKTYSLITSLQTFAKDCVFTHVFFSKIESDSVVEPHCGPTNLRVRAHLALRTTDEAQLYVENDGYKWKTGKVLLFDDSKCHSVKIGSDVEFTRVVLVIDLWNPLLTVQELSLLKFIFKSGSW